MAEDGAGLPGERTTGTPLDTPLERGPHQGPAGVLREGAAALSERQDDALRGTRRRPAPQIPTRSKPASTAASAVMFTMRRALAVGVRMCTALAAPSRIGPTVMPSPPATFRMLNAILAASTFGMMRRLASVLRREPGNTLSRIGFESAASPCISPSTSRSG